MVVRWKIMRLFNKKIKVDDEEYWLTINKCFYGRIAGDDHYEYKCNLYKEINSWIGVRKKRVYSYKTNWLHYTYYHGDIDLIIDKVINKYKRNLREQKYITENERNFKSKYEA